MRVAQTNSFSYSYADMAQVAEHVLGKDEVTSSNLVISSKKEIIFGWFLFLLI